MSTLTKMRATFYPAEEENLQTLSCALRGGNLRNANSCVREVRFK